MKNSKKSNKEIKDGKYRDCYLVYTRKSTDESENQKNSIEYQEKENKRFATDNGFKIASLNQKGLCSHGIISERHSGFKEGNELSISDDGLVQYRIDRPKFKQMVQYVAQGYFKGIICLCWDRISRNKGDDTIIRKLMRRGVDIHFVYAKYDKSSSGELHMDIDGMFAQHHSRVTSEKVRATIRNSRNKGICTYRAPIGYLNEGTMDNKPYDPDRAPVISDMFKLYATGDWSLSDLARHANQLGMTTVPVRRPRTEDEMLADVLPEIDKVSRPITENHVSRILKNEFYTGKVLNEDGVYIPSISHKALIDDKTFLTVQSLLSEKTVSIHYTKKLDHPLRGIVRCAYCKRVYTPYSKKGILYFNARCKRGCKNSMKNCNFDYLAEQFLSILSTLYFTQEERVKLDARTSTEIALLEEKRLEELSRLERRKKRAREELAYLRTNRLTLLKSGAYTPEALVQEQQKLETMLNTMLGEEFISEAAMTELVKDVILFSELLENAETVYIKSNPHQKEQIIRLIFSELFVAQDMLEYKIKKGLEPFDDRISALCDPTAWLSELFVSRQDFVCRMVGIQALLRMSPHNVITSCPKFESSNEPWRYMRNSWVRPHSKFFILGLL